jgi:putative endonuclease
MIIVKFLHVYILKCSDDTYYTGVSNNPEKRLEQHNSGINKNSYTAQRLPVLMPYCERFADFHLAIKWEKRIKKWSREKKEALIKENWNHLQIAAACKNKSSSKGLLDTSAQ